MAFETGQRVGDYEVVRTLGAGGLGQVYEVRHTISQRSEAMKILLPGQIATPELAERFRREIQLLGALNHPHIAALHNAFYFDSQLTDKPLFGRLKLGQGQFERIVDLKGISRYPGPFGQWIGVGPDDSPILARDIRTQEIYALDVQFP